jgi:hypothetical protein
VRGLAGRKPQVNKKSQVIEITCLACGKLKKSTEFYTSSSVYNAGTGRVQYCKDCCIKMSCDENGVIDINKFKTTLEKIDKPFLGDVLQSAYEESKKSDKDKNPLQLYFKNINSLGQYSKLTWKDSIFENGLNNNEVHKDNILIYSPEWRGSYTKSDLEYLENYYLALHDDFKIITRNHKDYARKIAKASLAMDRAYDDMLVGVTGSDKRYKDLKDAFDQLSKSAQFSENTRGINDVSLGCFGVVFDKVEQKKWIPQHIPLEKDDYDKLIDYFSTINKSI